jgi:hypothetical protein
MSKFYFNPWIYPPIPGSWEIRNDYEIIVHFLTGNRYHCVLVGGAIAVAGYKNPPIPSHQYNEEVDVARSKCKEIWGDRAVIV